MAIPAQLMQLFLRVDKRYSINPNEEPFFDLPTSLFLERVEYVPPTEQEIKQQVNNKLLVPFNKKKDAILERYQRTIDSIELKRQQAQNKWQLDKEYTQENLDAKIAQITYDMLQRGLSRSSVYDEMVKKAKQEASVSTDKTNLQLQLTLAELTLAQEKAVAYKDMQLSNLQKNFNAELAQEILEETEAVAKKIESVAKYNNTLEEKESQYKREWNTAYIDAKQAHSQVARSLLTLAINDGYETIQQYIYQDKATFTKDYYLGLTDSTSAYNEFVSLQVEFVEQLSQTYFDQVEAFLRERL